MQDWRFDDFTRTLGRATSRRQVFKGLLAGVVAATIGRSIRATSVSAASACSQATCRRRAEAAFSECVSQSRRSHGGVQPCVDELLARTHLCAATGCLENESCCDSACVDFAQDAQHCGSCGNVCPQGVSCVAGVCDCGPGKAACNGQCIGTQFDVLNCGSCGNVCPGYQQPNTNVTCSSGICTFSCQGECYDVNGDPADGCESADAPVGNHLQASALQLTSMGCFDGTTQHIDGKLVSDRRVHEDPSVPGFDSVTGSAPDWYQVAATGGLCVDDLSFTLQMVNSSFPTCYKLTVMTDRATFTATTDATGFATITSGSGSYDDNTTIYIEVEKTCSTASVEEVNYTVDFHL